MVPVGLALLLLAGIAPLLSWGRTSRASLRRNLGAPAICASLLAAALFAGGIRSAYVLVSFGLSLFVAVAIGMEFYRGARAIRWRSRLSLMRALVVLTSRYTRRYGGYVVRYGGYVVHLGMALMFVGFTGSAFNRSVKSGVRVGTHVRVGENDLLLPNVANR
jgi:cytochrome c-type biogenesis protein CcmF